MSASGVEPTWLGGRLDADWTWSDKSAWDFENWGPGEPNNQGGGERENVLGINWPGFDDWTGLWNDWPENNLHHRICQYEP